MSATVTTPTGRALVNLLDYNGHVDPAMLDYVLAIEAEAAATVTQGLMEAMKPYLRHKHGCASYFPTDSGCNCGLVHTVGYRPPAIERFTLVTDCDSTDHHIGPHYHDRPHDGSDRCRPVEGYHADPHRGCVLR